MASKSPSPNSPPSAVPPVSPENSIPPSSSSLPANASVPPPLSSPPPSSSSPPPSQTQSPPPSLPASPHSPPSLPPPLPPPAPTPLTPTATNAPSPQPSGSPPPKESSAPTTASPPPLSSFTPPSISSPQSPPPHRPKHSPPPPISAPPPTGSPPLTPTDSPPPASSASPPPPVPSSSSPPSISPRPPLNNSFVNVSSRAAPLPSFPSENPTSRSTQSSPNKTTDSTSRSSGGANGGLVTAVGSFVGLFAFALVVGGVWYMNTRKKRKDTFNLLQYSMPSPFASSQHSDSSFLKPQESASSSNYIYSPDNAMGSSRSWFTYQELSEATSSFSASNLLGEGGFGCVYKGIMVDGRVVAVKQLKAGGGQGEREFRAEVEIISRIHHRHLVSLVGYCISDNQRLLVYDYVPNNTLYHHLHGEGKPVMNWGSRVKVAAGAARGLAYLHEDCQPRIIHRDIKSTNILLENNFEARVADFGLAKLALELDLHTHVSTRVMGTFGYLAPEYASTGKLTEKSDVFSFGVVLLELITGRKPVDSSQPLGDESLVEWARPLLTQALDKEDFGVLVDPKLENKFVGIEMFRMIEAAAACVRHLASKRPKMSQVVRALDSMDELADLNNGMKPGQSGIFSSTEHSSSQMRMFQRIAFGSQDLSSDFYNRSQDSLRNS